MPSDAIIGRIQNNLLVLEIYRAVPLPDGSTDIDYRKSTYQKNQVNNLYLAPISQIRGEQIDIKVKNALMDVHFFIAFDANGNNNATQYISIDGRNDPRGIADVLEQWQTN